MKILNIKGKEFQVDDEDFEWLNDLNWCLTSINLRYASIGHGVKHQHRQIYLHRMIMLAEYGYDKVWDGDVVIDHIDRNTFNNQKSNLRLINRQENTWNRAKQKKFKPNSITSSKFIGVYRNFWKTKNGEIKLGTYTATISGKNIGSYKTQEEAAQAYDKECLKLRGKFAILNFPYEKSISS